MPEAPLIKIKVPKSFLLPSDWLKPDMTIAVPKEVATEWIDRGLATIVPEEEK